MSIFAIDRMIFHALDDAKARSDRVIVATAEARKSLLHGIVALCLVTGIAKEAGEQLTKLTRNHVTSQK